MGRLKLYEMWILRPQFERRNQISRIRQNLIATRNGSEGVSFNVPRRTKQQLDVEQRWYIMTCTPAFPHDVMESVVKALQGEKRQATK